MSDQSKDHETAHILANGCGRKALIDAVSDATVPLMENGDGISLLDMIDTLQKAEIGDSTRLAEMRERLVNGRTIYNSDRAYVKDRFQEVEIPPRSNKIQPATEYGFKRQPNEQDTPREPEPVPAAPADRFTLSPSQKEAIVHNSGHLRIIACPGSGKTETVSRRVASLIESGIKPSSIVAFTFTVKAADELKIRIRNMLGDEQENSGFGDMFIGTIDSFCLYMLKKINPRYRNYEILDDARRNAFLDRWYLRIGLKNLDDGSGKWNTIRKFHRSVDVAISEQVDLSDITNRDFVDCYEEYAKVLNEEKFFDFVSIIRTLLDVLEKDKDALDMVNCEVKHIVFDEYQDVNLLQERMLELLSEKSDSVCVVGDDDQNIFQWRGSNIKHIAGFPDKYEKHGVTEVTLGTNYRATEPLVRMAARFINNNCTRLEKEMKAHKGQHNKFEDGDMFCRHFNTDEEELGFVCDAIGNLLGTEFATKSGTTRPLTRRDMAVIVRTNNDAARMIKVMKKRGIPCLTDSGASVFDYPIVTLAINCIMYAFEHAGYKAGETPDIELLSEAYESAVPKGDPGRFKKELGAVRRIADVVKARAPKDWLPNLGLQEFYQRVLSAMGAELGVFDDDDLYHLAVLSKAIADYEYVHRALKARQVAGLRWFIESAESSYSDPLHGNPGLDAVRILTIWKAKGLEFPAVFVPSFDNRRRPRPEEFFIDDSLYPKERYYGTEEDERRAFYTAITRSQKHLFLTSSERLLIGGTQEPPRSHRAPHQFVAEIVNGEFSDSHTPRPKIEGEQAVENGMLQSSYSNLSVYWKCPHEYRLSSVMGFSRGSPVALGYGTNMHSILNQIHTGYIQGKKVPDDKEISGMFDDMFYMRFAPGSLSESLRQAGLRSVREYVRENSGRFGQLLETEKRFETAVGGAIITGSIDLIRGEDGIAEITDFKTGRSEDRYDNHAQQVRFYAHAAEKSLGLRLDSASIHHLHTQVVEPVDIGTESIEQTRGEIAEMVRGITSGEFEAAPEGKKCRGCDFRAVCAHKGFEVGVGFEPVKPVPRKDIDDEPQGELGPSIVSSAMRQNAERLADGHIVPKEDGRYEVESMSEPGKRYVVIGSGCGCRGFAEYSRRHPGTVPTCSHVEAVKLFQGKSN